jgi:class 3 adenylate cyclase
MTAATACRTCGSEPREGARFCDGCGAPITERNAHAEYKQVTVLFADVVRSMDIAAAVGGCDICLQLIPASCEGSTGYTCATLVT